jgi:hypothetical protein
VTTWFQTATRFRDPAGAIRMAQFVDALARFPVGHLVDLGAGHGMFSQLAADLGWQVTAVDARAERFPDDPRVRWVVADVRDFDEYDDVTVVANLGLWYHLTLADQLLLAKKAAPRPLILDTHFALPRASDHRWHRMSELVSDRGYEGRLYSEEGLELTPTASWGNSSSFWPTVAGLEKQLFDAGYDVFEQVSPPHAPDRRYFVARSFGTDSDRAKLDALLAPYNEIEYPEAQPKPRPMFSLSVSAGDTGEAGGEVPLDVAAVQFAGSVTKAARRGAGKVVRRARKQLQGR